MAFLQAHWVEILAALLAVDRILISLWPSQTIFAKIAEILQNFGAK